tara:strand:- start:764 stop:910 length:147 start_codon:yes stop_codon:yes gene_type:complete
MHKINDNVGGFVVISNTEKVNPFYKDFVPDTYIFNEYKPSILSNLFRR